MALKSHCETPNEKFSDNCKRVGVIYLIGMTKAMATKISKKDDTTISRDIRWMQIYETLFPIPSPCEPLLSLFWAIFETQLTPTTDFGDGHIYMRKLITAIESPESNQIRGG